jgi:hypothetical protein
VVKIYDANNEADLAMLTGLLETEGILFHVSQGPLHAAGLPAVASEKGIFVTESDAKRARALIDEYLARVHGPSPQE